MSDDEVFRRILVATTLVAFPVALYFRLKSQATREPLDRRQEGVFILATLRPAGFLFLIGLVVYMASPPRMEWSSMPLSAWTRAIGAALGAASTVLLFWTLASLGKNLTDTVVTRREHTLVTHGPYRWVRHPFYVSVLLLMMGSALMAANWFLLLTGAIVFTMMAIRMRIEEQKLLERFGEPYRRYRDTTGAFFPRL